MSILALDNIFVSDSEDEYDGDPLKRDWSLGREALLFVVDANLFQNQEKFFEALYIIRGAFISGLLTNDKDLLGLVFANTARSKEPLEAEGLSGVSIPEHCSVFLPLRQLNKNVVDHFLQFIVKADKCFMEDYGIAPQNGCGSFAQMIRMCLSLFDTCGVQVNNATLVFLTDRDSPHSKLSNEWQMALLKAKDLEGKGVEFHVIPMRDEFDYNEFYAEFLTLSKDIELDSFVAPDPKLLRERLTDRKLRQDILERSLGRITFSLGPGLDILVQYYNYFKRRSYPRKVKLMRRDNSIVQQKHVLVLRKQDSEEREVKLDARWYELSLGGMPIRVTPAQMTRVRNLHPPGLMLLGFKPKDELPTLTYYKPCNFMYPDERKVAGSKCLFRALWQRCLERDKIAICLFMRKRNSIPRYVALVPVASRCAATEERDNFLSLLSGDGFKIVYLPMAKHVRQIDFTDWNNSAENCAPEEGVKVFRKIVRKLRCEYQPHLFNDPTLEVLQAKILSLSLNMKTDYDGCWDGFPDTDAQDKRLAVLLPKVEEIFGRDAEAAKKRRRDDGGGGSEAKIAKINDEDLDSVEYVKNLIAQQALPRCTVAQLRIILEQHFELTLPKSTTKAVLIERISAEGLAD